MVMHPRGSYIVDLLLSLEVATPESKSNSSRTLSPAFEESPPHSNTRFLVGCSSPPFHATRRAPHGASHAQGYVAMSAWSVKTRRSPSRHCRDARVYGHTATTMHDICQILCFNRLSTCAEAHWFRLHRIWIRLYRMFCVT